MNYRDYQNTRDAAWQILLDCGIDRLPVDLNIICSELGVRHVSYAKYWTELPPVAEQTDGMAFYRDGVPIILYDNRKPSGRIRFTVAHELGHLILGHVKFIPMASMHREPQASRHIEVAANQFAARLLAPACVLWGLGLHSAEDIMKVCHISRQAAIVRARRMAILYKRDRFLTSPMEKELYQRFQEFIREGFPDHSK